jgi:hypothetical protein
VRFKITEAPAEAARGALGAFKANNRLWLGSDVPFDNCSTLQQRVLLEVAARSKLIEGEASGRLGVCTAQMTAVAYEDCGKPREAADEAPRGVPARNETGQKWLPHGQAVEELGSRD